jgi:hypothetical protein
MNEKAEVKRAAPERPLCLELLDARDRIFAVINDCANKHRIPFYLLESIVNDAARQVSRLADTERENARRRYENENADKGGAEDGCGTDSSETARSN